MRRMHERMERMESGRKERESRMTRERIPQFSCRDLFRSKISRFTRVQPNVLLKYESVGEFLMTDGTDVEETGRRFRSVDTHVGFEVSFGGESPSANLTLEGSLSSVRSVVHLECGFARKDPVTDNALIRIHQFVFNVVHQLL